MNCDQFHSQLIELIYGELNHDVAARCREHAADCPACGGELADLEQTQSILDAVPPVQTRVDLARLCLRMAARQRRARARWTWAAVGAAAALLVATGLLAALVRIDVVPGRVELAWRGADEAGRVEREPPAQNPPMQQAPSSDAEPRLAVSELREASPSPLSSTEEEARRAFIRSGRYLLPDTTYVAARDRALALGVDSLARSVPVASNEADASAASYQELLRELLPAARRVAGGG